MFPIYVIRLTIFRSIVEHLSQRGVFNNVEVIGAIRWLRLEIVHIEIMQQDFVDKYCVCHRNSIGTRYYRHGLIFKQGGILNLTDL